MHDYTSRQLYMANGGNKLYIYKDGFGDNYNATAAEEAAWSIDVVDRALGRIETEENRTSLQFAIEDLLFHKYENTVKLLIDKLKDTSPARRIVFATALWKITGYEKSFEIIRQILAERKSESLDDVFLGLNELKDNTAARNFLIACLDGDDELLHTKAQKTISMWSWSGMTRLKENNLLDLLRPENKDSSSFSAAIEQLKRILTTGDQKE